MQKQQTQSSEVSSPGQLPVGTQASNNLTKYLAIVVLVIVATAGGFFAGMQYGKSNGPRTATATGPGGINGMGMGQMGQRGGIGTVSSVSSDSITISLMSRRMQEDGAGVTSKTYKITTSTKVTNNGATAAIGDIKTGDRVRVEASTDSADTASTILLNPPMARMQGVGSTQSDQAPSDQSDDGSNT